MVYSISNEYSTMGEYSLKCTTSTNWHWIYYGVPYTLMSQITVPFTFKCDISTTGGELLIVIVDNNKEKNINISLSAGNYPVEITYNEPITNLSRVQLGYRYSEYGGLAYIDNIRLYY